MSRELISHPHDPRGDPHMLLMKHSTAVRDRATALFHPHYSDSGSYLRTVALLHDFGKVTPQFQEYIRGEYDGPEEEKNHGRLGAYLTFYALGVTDSPSLDRLAGTLAVARHHQRLPNASSYGVNTLAEAIESETLRNQVTGIDSTWPTAADEFIQIATGGSGSWSDFLTQYKEGTLASELRDLCGYEELPGWYARPESLPDALYDRTLHYWSTLTLADKSHAANIDTEAITEFETLSKDPLERHIARLQSEEHPPLTEQLNTRRQAARHQAMMGVHEWQEDPQSPNISTLTLPTGLGKTFTGLSSAFEVRDRLNSENRTPVIVYALPYTSIIEQTREHFETPEIWGESGSGAAFTVHHYLSETVVDTNDEADSDSRLFLGESWRSGVVLTTFVQLFESLTGPPNSSGTKLPALDNGIVILDEPQALPKDWWDAIRRLLDLLVEEYDTTIISMTATQPALLDDVGTVSLIQAGADHDPVQCPRCTTEGIDPSHDRAEYFEFAERVTYTLDESALCHSLDSDAEYVDHSEAAERTLSRAADESAVLSICNTIASSRSLTEAISEAGPDTRHVAETYESLLEDGEISPATDATAAANRTLRECGLVVEDEISHEDEDCPVFVGTFNSRYRPVDRDVLLDIASTLSTESIPFVFVSTQAVEAGVDISFQTVYRDIAPLDSIVQAAGRCNRSFEWGKQGGTVIVWTLANSEEQTPEDPTEPCPAEYVYENGVPGHLRLISDVLTDVDETDGIPDRRIAYTAVKEYFDRLSSEKSLSASDIRDEIDQCEAADLGTRSLIQDYDTVDVVVGVTPQEVAAIDSVTRHFQNDQYESAYDELDELAHLRVSLPTDDIADAIDVPRIDLKPIGEDGPQLFRYTGDGGLEYQLDSGGLTGTDDVIAGRFTGI